MNLNQTVKRRVSPEARAGQYMCPECGKLFDTKKEVDSHMRKVHEPRIPSIHNGLATH